MLNKTKIERERERKWVHNYAFLFVMYSLKFHRYEPTGVIQCRSDQSIKKRKYNLKFPMCIDVREKANASELYLSN